MPSRRTVIALIGSAAAGGYYFRDRIGATAAQVRDEADEAASEVTPADWDPRAAAEACHDAINDYRTDLGREELTFDKKLYDIARSYAQRMAEEDFYGHEDPQGRGFEYRYQQAGYQCDAAGYTGAENIQETWFLESISKDNGETAYYSTPEEVGVGTANGWIDSPPHRENILLDVWNGQGVGFAITDENKVYAVQNFC